MSQHNPYEASTVKELRSTPAVPDDALTFARYAQMLLRVVGTWLTIEGIAGIFGSLVYGAIQYVARDDPQYSRPMDLYSIAWLTTSVMTCVGGLYLVVGGRFVLEKVFLPGRDAADEEERQSDNNG